MLRFVKLNGRPYNVYKIISYGRGTFNGKDALIIEIESEKNPVIVTENIEKVIKEIEK